MTLQGRPSAGQWALIVVVAALAATGFALGVRALLQWSSDHELHPQTPTDRLMARKSEQLSHIVDGMLEHDYRKVEKAAEELHEISDSMEYFISDADYSPDRTAYEDSLDALEDAVRHNNSNAAIESADRLVDSCLRCHEHLVRDGRLGVGLGGGFAE